MEPNFFSVTLLFLGLVFLRIVVPLIIMRAYRRIVLLIEAGITRGVLFVEKSPTHIESKVEKPRTKQAKSDGVPEFAK